jgi:hypothetical protein
VLAAAAVARHAWLLPGPEDDAHTEPAARGGMPRRATVLRALGLLGLLALLGAIAEDVPTSWSALYLRDGRGADPGAAGAGFVRSPPA